MNSFGISKISFYFLSVQATTFYILSIYKFSEYTLFTSVLYITILFILRKVINNVRITVDNDRICISSGVIIRKETYIISDNIEYISNYSTLGISLLRLHTASGEIILPPISTENSAYINR